MENGINTFEGPLKNTDVDLFRDGRQPDIFTPNNTNWQGLINVKNIDSVRWKVILTHLQRQKAWKSIYTWYMYRLWHHYGIYSATKILHNDTAADHSLCTFIQHDKG